MPYYVFAVKPLAQLEQLGEHASYPDASRHARALRAAQAPGVQQRIRIMFADDALAAEDLLLQVRDAPPDGDD